MRSLPDKVPELPELKAPQGTWELDIQAVTPIYKGGSNPKGIDEGIPFRGPSLKGLLRGWWRATRRTCDVAELRRREGGLFGEVSGEGQKASQVSLGVTRLRSKPASTPDKLGWITWVTMNDDDEPFHAAGASARLRVRASREAEQVERALRALLLFGGVGSRSRRGLGALWTDDTALLPAFGTPRELRDYAAYLAPSDQARPWPSLGGAQLAIGTRSHGDALTALREAHDSFQAIRGMRVVGHRRFSGDKRATIYQQEWLAVRDMVAGRARSPRGYTAALGMPLAYRSVNGHLQGRTVKLEPDGQGRDRLPSPVLVKPLKIAGRWRACFLVLQLWVRPRVKAGRNDIGPLPADALEPFLAALRSGRWGSYEVAPLNKEAR